MKKRKITCLALSITLLAFGTGISVSAMDGFDIMNNMTMDMILEQSYHTIDSVDYATDLAVNNNSLNHSMDSMMFFPDLLDVINTNNNNPNDAGNNLSFPDETIVAVDNGAWMPEFNNFFNNPTAEIPVDVEMANIDTSQQTVPAFYSAQPQDTIGDLNNSPDMDMNNNNSALDNSSDLVFAPEVEIEELQWDENQNPEAAMLDAAQPDSNTDMLDAAGGEIVGLDAH